MMRTGQKIRNYEVIRSLGGGGMGEVWEALQEGLFERKVAIKCLPDSYSASKELRKRFIRESRILAELEHGHILPVFESFEEAGRLYLVMQLVEGWSLAGLAEHSSVPPIHLVLKWYREILSALKYVHNRGVLHRDIKPSNIMITRNFEAKLIDFGIALSYGSHSRLTRAGVGVGTPRFMSPEQARGLEADMRSDLYSLALTIATVLAGQNVPEEFGDILDSIPSKIPRQVKKVVRKCLALDPRERYSSAQDVLDALSRKPIPFRTVLGGAASVVVLAIVILLTQNQDRHPIMTEMVTIPAGEFISGLEDYFWQMFTVQPVNICQK